jgi:hypothetical protein
LASEQWAAGFLSADLRDSLRQFGPSGVEGEHQKALAEYKPVWDAEWSVFAKSHDYAYRDRLSSVFDRHRLDKRLVGASMREVVEAGASRAATARMVAKERERMREYVVRARSRGRAR